ncbi:AraC family transcriptional regulator [Paludicola sp. MB14-C6]|uniref:AraC family transcriptional regulator n=1 Tax=Paludihabitans sp. MB14-C6 TaxID=3070656 RepID=UPI0027DB4505|nr:AraC family transcriptional regulator [Paludicola sp. MB14-C6]WMJ23896.1 AraC family transcriptional regulator [Paludicola sp. MB14-C6]
MQTSKYSLIQINDLLIEDKVGNHLISIKPGSYCTFNKITPTNARHYHKCYELCLVTEGSGLFIYGNDIMTVKKGDVFIADPDVLHEITVQTENQESLSSLNLFYFSFHLFHNDAPATNQPEEIIISKFLNNHSILKKSQQHMLSYLNFLYDYSKARENGNNKKIITYSIEQSVKGFIYECMMLLSKQTRSSKKYNEISNNIIDTALDYISLHITEKITLEKLSNHCNTSKRNLQLLFNQYLNTTIIDYINNRRMSLASSYLRMNFRINDIGPHVGIEDPAQFCRVFKKYYGISPKKYQMQFASNGMLYGADFK